MNKFYWSLLLLIILFILFIYHYPDIFALYHVPSGMVYLSQNSYFDPWDVNLYVSAIRYGQHAGIALPNLYTTTPNLPVYIYSVLTTLGMIFKTADPFLVFHWAAVATGILLIFGMFWGIVSLGFSYLKSMLLVYVVSLAGGFGFLGNSLSSADISSSAFTFYSTFQKPHEALGVLGYIISLILFYRLCIDKEISYVKLFFLVCFLSISVFIYPYFLISYFLTAGLFSFYLFRTKGKKLFGILMIATLPAFIISLFSYTQFLINPTFGNVGINLGLNIFSVFLGYGILIPVFVYYLFFIPKTKLGVFLSIWIFVTIILAFLPIGPGKIFFRGSFFPFCVVFVIAIDAFLKKKQSWNKYLVYGLFSILLMGTGFYIFYSRMTNSYSSNPWTYMSTEEFSVITYLNKNAKPGSGVLTYYMLSNQIPAFTNNRVFIGHHLQTPDESKKTNEAAYFIAGAGNIETKRNFLVKNNISYFVWGKKEEALYGKNINPENKIKELLGTLIPIYKNKGFVVYYIPENK